MEKRKLPRSLCSDLVTLEWKEKSGQMREASVLLEDISSRGACLQVESPVPEDVEAQLSHGEEWGIRCRVAYCTFREIGYFVGVEFPSGTNWKQSAFEPRHLVDPTELIPQDS